MYEDPQNRVTLTVGGKAYRGWTGVQVEAGITVLARAAQVTATRPSSTASAVDGIEDGLECVLKIGSDTVLTGYITGKTVTYSATTVSITVTMKSKTVDLVECSIPFGKPRKWAKSTAAAVVTAIAGFYGIDVVTNGLGTKKHDFDAPAGGTIGTYLLKVLRDDSLLLSDDEFGRLVIVDAGNGGTASEPLVYGENILSGSRVHDATGIFTDYVVIGQGADPKSENTTPANALKGTARNPGFKRTRWQITEQSGNKTLADLRKRATLLMRNSIGMADTVTYTVHGWRHNGSGELWRPNLLTTVEDGMLDISGKLVTGKVTLTRDDSGTVTSLELQAPEAWLVTDLPDDPKVKPKAVGSPKANGTTYLAKAHSGEIHKKEGTT